MRKIRFFAAGAIAIAGMAMAIPAAANASGESADMSFDMTPRSGSFFKDAYRPADWNRTREKYITGNTQIFSHGWLADYPDPENFLFLLHSPESPLICKCDGTNNANYKNDEYDAAYRAMRVLPKGEQRDKKIAEMIKLFQDDAVWLYAFTPREIYLNNAWVHNTKRHGVDKGTLKYLRIDPVLRAEKQALWNQPVKWPLYAGAIVLLGLIVPGVTAYRRRQNATAR